MNGQKYNYADYEWEPVPDDHATGYYVVDDTPVVHRDTPLAADIVAAPQDGMLFRPVSEVFGSARVSLNDSVLSKPVGELFSSARESLNDSVLSKPVREVFGLTAARRRRLAT